MDASFQVADWLTLGGSYAYTDARYTDPVGSAVGQTFVFGPHADAPEHQGSLFAQTNSDLGSLGQLNVRAQVYSQSEFFYSNNNDTTLPGTEIEGYTLAKLRVDLDQACGTELMLVLFVNNPNDEEYYTGGLPLGQVSGSNAAIPAAPRMWGLELRYNF
ncbi:MAG: hypothetical protein KTR17_11505 [Cellvibrionaceae bacterium]|nr:hypothetical protein [Cellvibrionaceae bacterium]